MKKLLFKHLICLMTLGLILGSCNIDDSETDALITETNKLVTQDLKNNIEDYLGELGYCDGVNFAEDGVYYSHCDVQGCAIFKYYKDFEEEMNNTSENFLIDTQKKGRIRKESSYSGYPTISNLRRGFKYTVDYSGCSHCHGTWNPYIKRAFDYFERTRRPFSEQTQTPFSSPHFREVGRNELPDLTITFADLEDSESGGTVYGSAGFPKNGKCGRTIRLQSNPTKLANLVSTDAYHAIVLHELMHTLGFQHANYDFHKSDPIPGVSSNDSESVLASFGSGGRNANMFFSPHDLKGLRKVYPEFLLKPTILSASKVLHDGSGNYHYTVSSKNRAIRRPYYWIEYQFYQGNVLVETRTIRDTASSQASGGGWQNITTFYSKNDYTWVTARGVNFKKDLRSAPSRFKRF